MELLGRARERLPTHLWVWACRVWTDPSFHTRTSFFWCSGKTFDDETRNSLYLCVSNGTITTLGKCTDLGHVYIDVGTLIVVFGTKDFESSKEIIHGYARRGARNNLVAVQKSIKRVRRASHHGLSPRILVGLGLAYSPQALCKNTRGECAADRE